MIPPVPEEVPPLELETDDQYDRAYAGVENPLGEDFEGWEDEGVWPGD